MCELPVSPRLILFLPLSVCDPLVGCVSVCGLVCVRVVATVPSKKL